MTIGQLSSQTGLPASTIRYYEKIGVLPRPPRVSGQRRYATDAIDKIAVLRLAQSCGFHLPEMKMLLQGFNTRTKPSERWRKLAERKKAELDLQIEKLALMRRLVDQVASCECIDLAECGRTACQNILA
jgi:MerR family transcriptional regulator, redox-sensitive transcriptional activator SoxR